MNDDLINKIHQADCLDFMKLLPDNSVDCICTDVPYIQEFHGRGMSKNRPNYLKIKEYGSGKGLDYTDFLDLCFAKLNQVNFFSFCDKETKFEFIKYAKEHRYGYKELCFCKTSPTPFTNNQWLPDVEYGVHIFKDLKIYGDYRRLPDVEYGVHIFKDLKIYGDYRTKRSFSVMANFKEDGIEHPTAKKVSEVERILQNISAKNDLILDPFSGSGTTAVACHNLGRRFICIEKDKDYFLASVKRLEDVQKQMTLFGRAV